MFHSREIAWFAVQVRSRSEQLVSVQLSLRGQEVFLPTYPKIRVWSDRAKTVKLPLIPGYVFCRFNPGECLPVVSTPGVLRIVSTGSHPTPVDDKDISNLKRIDASTLGREPFAALTPGTPVTIRQGPLKGVVGTLVRAERNTRLVVTVELLHRSVAVELDEAWVIPQLHEPQQLTSWNV